MKERKIIMENKNFVNYYRDPEVLREYDFYFSVAREVEAMPEEFLRQLSDEDWYWISRAKGLSLDFIEKFADLVIWKEISSEQILPESFIEKYADRVNWICISEHQVLSEEFIERFANKVYWSINKTNHVKNCTPCVNISSWRVNVYINWVMIVSFKYKQLTDNFFCKLFIYLS